MRKLIAYFFLAAILNVVLFHPLETMNTNTYLSVPDPINSIAEFVMEVCLDVQDSHPGDEREAESDHFNSTLKLFSAFENTTGLFARQNLILVEIERLPSNALLLPQAFTTIHNPPPEA